MPSLYQTELLDRVNHPQFTQPLSSPPTHQSSGANLSCGDEIAWELILDPSQAIQALRHQTRGCAVCQSSAELIAQKALHQPSSQILAIQTGEYLEQFGMPLSPMRQKCALLALNTLQEALKQTVV